MYLEVRCGMPGAKNAVDAAEFGMSPFRVICVFLFEPR